MPEDPQKYLNGLAAEYWENFLASNPIFATAIGVRKYDDKLPDLTIGARRREREQFKSIIDRCSGINENALADLDKLTRSALLFEAQSQLDYSLCELEDWTVDPLGGPQVDLLNIESFQPIRTFREAQSMIKRWMAIGKYVDDHIANLKRGLEHGKVAVRAGVEKSIEGLESQLAKPDSEWTFLRPLATPHEDWSEEERTEWKNGLERAMRETIRPAYARYNEFLKNEILPRARQQDKPGIMHVPGGGEAYAMLIKARTSLPLSADELHQRGLSEVSRINSEMEKLGEKVLGTSDRKEILRKLRTDRALYFDTREEVFEKADSALKKARRAIPKWFGRLPKTECEVKRMEEHEEKHSTIAYYRPPAADGSRPGRYYINTYAPETRPRYEAEALAYHESIPGHHLQLAIAGELEGIPEFRKHSGVTAFIEGWGLYSERLADEMGLYSSDLDRMGMLSYDSWRACRLVVDTGMHAKGWTREQAIRFMLENTALAENNIVNEVDRYIAWPAQALAYKTGQLEILRLRRRAEEAMGSRFDVRKFHDALLGDGALPLESLRGIIERHL
jgi:uncharacterized protein (DUF885 family)